MNPRVEYSMRNPDVTRESPARHCVLVRFEFIITSRMEMCMYICIYIFLSEYTLPRRAPRVIPAEIQFVIRPYTRYFIMSRCHKKPPWDAQTFSSGTTSGEFPALRVFPTRLSLSTPKKKVRHPLTIEISIALGCKLLIFR